MFLCLQGSLDPSGYRNAQSFGCVALFLLVTLFAGVGPNTAVAQDRVPLYQASRQAGAAIRVVVLGDNAEETEKLMRRWNTEFQRSFPDLSFYDDLIVEPDATKWPDYLEQGTIFVVDDRTFAEMRSKNIFEDANNITIEKFETRGEPIYVERNRFKTFVLHGYKKLRCNIESLLVNFNEISIIFNVNTEISLEEDGDGNDVCFAILAHKRFALYESGGFEGSDDYRNADTKDREFLGIVNKDDREKAIRIIRRNTR
jgi:hypothetical protein